MEDEAKLPTWVPKFFYRLLLVVGVLFYISWLTIFGAEHWNDVGVYSVTIILVSFGLVGAWLYDEIEKKELEDSDNSDR